MTIRPESKGEPTVADITIVGLGLVILGAMIAIELYENLGTEARSSFVRTALRTSRLRRCSKTR